uniref:Uncharacterized protein n=1 Tax=Arundo donax TaxID=35708 RepID=A0A0A9AGX3_ARUDO
MAADEAAPSSAYHGGVRGPIAIVVALALDSASACYSRRSCVQNSRTGALCACVPGEKRLDVS